MLHPEIGFANRRIGPHGGRGAFEQLLPQVHDDDVVGDAHDRSMSCTIRPKNRLVIWNERAMPRCASAYEVRPVTSCSSSTTLPPSGQSVPAIRLNTVLLPAPLGPMIEVIRPACAANDRSRTACSAPNDLLKASTRITARPGAAA